MAVRRLLFLTSLCFSFMLPSAIAASIAFIPVDSTNAGNIKTESIKTESTKAESIKRENIKADSTVVEPKLAVITREVTLVKVDKSKRRMYLLSHDQVLKEYRVALGEQPQGHKRFEGDSRTPEGKYVLDYVLEDSGFYRSVHISYPQAKDRKWAEKYDVEPGGHIMVHGLKNGEQNDPDYIQSFDWTDGCIALTNQQMDEFIQLVEMGTPIHIEW